MSFDLDSLPKKSILIVGDVILDRYLWGEVSRISPEAPVPVVRAQERSEVLGGACNVAANISGLEYSVAVIGVCGNDETGRHLMDIINEKGIENLVLIDDYRPTITKTRIMAHGQQLLRLDEEEPQLFTHELQDRILALISKELPHHQTVILSDYGKGMFLSPAISRHIIDLCQKHEVSALVDPKSSDWECYRGATCVTPNTSELGIVTGSLLDNDEEKLISSARSICKRYDLKWLLITRGSKGMCLVGSEDSPFLIPAQAREVYDVSGAGDTVIATLAIGIASGLSFPEAAKLANEAAGVVVGKLGTQPVTRVELKAAMRMNQSISNGANSAKVASVDAARVQVQAWRTSGEKIVFTNGCFDLLHPGHIHLVHQASALGDRLVIGLNADSSVRRLKGPNRPILPEQDRAVLLAALSCVDLVVTFEEDTPLALLEALRPDILVKGADYRPKEVVGRELVKSYGGKVHLVPLLEGLSTTRLVNKIVMKE